MSDVAEPPAPASLPTAPSLWPVRLAALASVALLVLPFAFHDPCSLAPPEPLAGPLLLAGPYLWVLLRLSAAGLLSSVKLGLAWARVTGGLAFLISAVVSLANLPSVIDLASRAVDFKAWFVVGYWLVWTLVQLRLVVSANRAYEGLDWEEGEKERIQRRAAIRVGGYLLLAVGIWFWLLVPDLLRSRIRANVSSAVGSVRTINTGNLAYAEAFPKRGFAQSLEQLGSPPGPGHCTDTMNPDAACLIDSTLASGRKSGYMFFYTPGKPDANGVVTTYTISAWPADGCPYPSFFSDQTGVIRSTHEGRAATAQDPLLQ